MSIKKYSTGASLIQTNTPPSVGIFIPPIYCERPLILPFVGIYTFFHHQKGLTLLELMTVIVIGGILLGFAVPSISAFIKNTRIVTQTNDLMADLSLARSEAIKRRVNVVICKSSNSTATNPSCDAGATWAQGRVMFVDSIPINSPNNAFDAGETVLRIREPLAGGNTLNIDIADADLRNFIAYVPPTGTTWTDNDSDSDVYNFRLCDNRGPSQGRLVTVEITGRPVITKNPAAC